MKLYVVNMGYIDENGASETCHDYERTLGAFSSLNLAQLLAENIVAHGLTWADDSEGGSFVDFKPGEEMKDNIELKWFSVEAFNLNEPLNLFQ